MGEGQEIGFLGVSGWTGGTKKNGGTGEAETKGVGEGEKPEGKKGDDRGRGRFSTGHAARA